METFVTVVILYLGLKFGAGALYTAIFSTKKKTKKISSEKKSTKDPRELAIQNLMSKVEQAKRNHPDLVQDPERAAKILKLWVDQDKTRK